MSQMQDLTSHSFRCCYHWSKFLKMVYFQYLWEGQKHHKMTGKLQY